jgi:hypothetical protein
MSTPGSVPAEIQRIRSATYTGRDPANLATAVVDGQAQLVRVNFATTVGMHPPQAVEDAVKAAVVAAVRSLTDAWSALDPARGLAEPAEGSGGGAA